LLATTFIHFPSFFLRCPACILRRSYPLLGVRNFVRLPFFQHPFASPFSPSAIFTRRPLVHRDRPFLPLEVPFWSTLPFTVCPFSSWAVQLVLAFHFWHDGTRRDLARFRPALNFPFAASCTFFLFFSQPWIYGSGHCGLLSHFVRFILDGRFSHDSCCRVPSESRSSPFFSGPHKLGF